MLRKVLLAAFMVAMLFAVSCKKEEPAPSQTSTIQQQAEKAGEDTAKQAEAAKKEAGKALEEAGKELQE